MHLYIKLIVCCPSYFSIYDNRIITIKIYIFILHENIVKNWKQKH